MGAMQLYEILSAHVFKMGAIFSFCKVVVLMYEMGGVQLFQSVAVLVLEMWIVLLYEIRGVLMHVMGGHVMLCVMGAVHL